MRRLCFVIGLSFGVLYSLNSYAAQVQIGDVSYSGQSTTKIVFQLSAATKHRAFTLINPSRLVVDIENARFQQSINQAPGGHPLIVNVRSAARNAVDQRVVFELNGDVDAKAALTGTRIQIDLTPKAKAVAGVESQATPIAPAPDKKTVPADVVAIAPKSKLKPVKAEKGRGRDIVVAVDAGHGGKDVGAQGSNGTQEKDVVFAIAKRLESMINHQPGMKAVMVRKGDYFVHLNQRRKIARDAKADLFVSIHADAFSDDSAHGASVYTLSKKGASSAAARWLADSENAFDMKEGGSADKDDTLTSVLLDLSQTATKEASQNVGSKVLKNFRQVGHLHRDTVQKAGFVVLKSADIPSILVETAFISNPEEERRLTSRVYQDKMAGAIFSGVMAHFKQYAPANTLMAQMSKSGNKALKLAAAEPQSAEVAETPASQPVVVAAVGSSDIAPSSKSKHIINPGETLSGIAQQYKVSMRAIRNANGLEDGNVKVGQVLNIPRNS